MAALGLLLDKVNMSQQCPFLTKNANGLLETHPFQHLPPSRLREADLTHLLSTGEATPGVLYLVLGSPVEKRFGHTAESLMKRHKNDYWIGAHLSYKERLRALGLFTLEEGRLDVQMPDGRYEEYESRLPHSIHLQDKKNRHKLKYRIFCSNLGKTALL